MASEQTLATPPSKEAFLNALLEDVRAYNARQSLYVGLGGYQFDAEMPLLLNPPKAPLACREPAALFDAINAHFSAQIHAFFNALHDFEEKSSDDPDLIDPDVGLLPSISIINQSYDIYPDCYHRFFHTRRLTVQDPDRLPLLNRVTQLSVFPDPQRNDTWDPGMNSIFMRPISPRAPLELATRLPNLRELDCPWLWERLPVAFSSRALRRIARPWEGPWRDARVEFGRSMRDVMPLLASSLTKARFRFWKPSPCGEEADQAVQMPDLVGASSEEFGGKDPVSLGLRDLGTRLEELDVCALITADLFPSCGDGDDTTGHNPLSWPHMRHLKVEFHPCAPNGSWYFSGPRGEDPHATGFAITSEEHYPPGLQDDDETHALWDREGDDWDNENELCEAHQPDMFRTLPIAERIEPLLLTFASCLQRDKMPNLQDAELFTWLMWKPSEERAREYEGSDEVPPLDSEDEPDKGLFRWGVRYEAPKGDGKGKVTWQVGEDWRPGQEVMRAFEDLVGWDGENMEWKSFEFIWQKETDDSVPF